jgi:hypothetical protein
VQRRICERILPLINPTAWAMDDVSVPRDGQDAIGETTAIANGGNQGTSLLIPYRREPGESEVEAERDTKSLPSGYAPALSAPHAFRHHGRATSRDPLTGDVWLSGQACAVSASSPDCYGSAQSFGSFRLSGV